MQIRRMILGALLILFVTARPIALPAQATEAIHPTGAGPLWSGEFQLRFDTYRGVLPIPDDGASNTINDFRRRELPDNGAGLGIRQLARLQAYFAPTPYSAVHITLRNYGYWGVGYYTSGTYGIQAFTADPFSLEEYALHLPALGGTVSVGAQYFQFGPVGLLAATPLSEADGMIHPVQSIAWERGHGKLGMVAIAGRLHVDFDEDERPIGSDEYVAIRVDRTVERLHTGLNLLLSGRQKERGLSWDVQSNVYRAEIAIAQQMPASAWHVAAYGELMLRQETTRLQLGYAAENFPLLFTQMADRGGLIPLQQGRVLLGVEHIWDMSETSLAHSYLRHHIAPDLPHSWELNVGWTTALAGSAVLNTEWTQWIGEQPSYARLRTALHFQF